MSSQDATHTTPEPPLTNRGVEIEIDKELGLDIHADYLAITFWSDPSKVFPLIYHHLWDLAFVSWDTPLQRTQNGARGYASVWVSLGKSRFYAHPINATDRYCGFEITGEPISNIENFNSRVLNLVDALRVLDIKFRASRFDLAYDHCPFTPQQAYDEWLSGRVKSRIQREQHMWISSLDGKTLYVGSSKSEKRLRIYDRKGFTRVEIQARKGNADALFGDWLYKEERLLGWLCGVAVWEADWFSALLTSPVRLNLQTVIEPFMLQRFRKYLQRLLPTLKIANQLFEGGIDDWLRKNDFDLTGPQDAKLKLLLKESQAHPELSKWPI